MKITNSYFEKGNNYIVDINTDNPTLRFAGYSLVEPLSFGAKMTSHGFSYDGQIFTRNKTNGGNAKSRYVIYGEGMDKQQILARRGEYIHFKEMINALVSIGKDPISEMNGVENLIKDLA